MFISTKYGTIETLLNSLYSLFEYDSALYVDDLGYKWYVLETVLDVLGISEEEYINGVYLMEIDNKSFISEEGINMLILEYDNEYQEDVKTLLASEVIPDIKSDSMYISDNVANNIRNIAIKYQVYVDNNNEEEMSLASKLQKNVERKFSRRQKIKRNK